MRSDPSDDRPALAPSAAVASAASDTPSRRFTVSISQRTLWLAAGVALVALVVILALARALGAVLLILLAITLAEAIRPLVARLERIRVPRPVGALLIYLVVAALLAGIGWLLFAPLAAQINELANNLPQYLEQAQQWAKDAQQALAANDPLSALFNALAAQLAGALQTALPTILQFPLTLVSGVFGGLLSIVIVITMSVFWLMSADKLRNFALGLAPEEGRAGGALLFTDLGRTLGGWVRGTLVAMLLIGLLTASRAGAARRAIRAAAGHPRRPPGADSLPWPLDQRRDCRGGHLAHRRSAQGARGHRALHHHPGDRRQSRPAVRDELGGACRSAARAHRHHRWRGGARADRRGDRCAGGGNGAGHHAAGRCASDPSHGGRE